MCASGLQCVGLKVGEHLRSMGCDVMRTRVRVGWIDRVSEWWLHPLLPPPTNHEPVVGSTYTVRI